MLLHSQCANGLLPLERDQTERLDVDDLSESKSLDNISQGGPTRGDVQSLELVTFCIFFNPSFQDLGCDGVASHAAVPGNVEA